MKINSPYSCKQKPKIDYPCHWQYTVIGEDKEAIEEAVYLCCGGKEITFTYSHTSSGGKYHSFKVELNVKNEEDRLSIYNLLNNHAATKVVI